jgi:hypothetical protein
MLVQFVDGVKQDYLFQEMAKGIQILDKAIV